METTTGAEPQQHWPENGEPHHIIWATNGVFYWVYEERPNGSPTLLLHRTKLPTSLQGKAHDEIVAVIGQGNESETDPSTLVA
ncbi:MAG: hypothetical protein PHI23_03710 [Candidatus Peribacteraceae bacterium]|nr:hypothetical protein [Candidatus Peribacteraceae bacterium]